MIGMKKFMVVHRDSTIGWAKVEKNWAKLSKIESATWIRSCFNKEQGIRYCLWLAPDEAHLKTIFYSIDVGWESIVEVEETVPDLWGQELEENLSVEEGADARGF
jgi:hypothetical protein